MRARTGDGLSDHAHTNVLSGSLRHAQPGTTPINALWATLRAATRRLDRRWWPDGATLRGWRRGSATEMLRKRRQRGRVCGVGSFPLAAGRSELYIYLNPLQPPLQQCLLTRVRSGVPRGLSYKHSPAIAWEAERPDDMSLNRAHHIAASAGDATAPHKAPYFQLEEI